MKLDLACAVRKYSSGPHATYSLRYLCFLDTCVYIAADKCSVFSSLVPAGPEEDG